MPSHLRIALSVFAALATAASSTAAASGHDGAATAIPAAIDVPLDAVSTADLPREEVSASAHGQTLSCAGVPLIALLRRAGAMPAEPLRGAQLARRLEASARDGYRVTFSLAELDPSLGNRRVLVVDRCDGKPLSAEDGPLRLIVPEDARPARWIRQLQHLTVLAP